MLARLRGPIELSRKNILLESANNERKAYKLPEYKDFDAMYADLRLG
jgi:hypothetical protein